MCDECDGGELGSGGTAVGGGSVRSVVVSPVVSVGWVSVSVVVSVVVSVCVTLLGTVWVSVDFPPHAAITAATAAVTGMRNGLRGFTRLVRERGIDRLGRLKR
jgi:uncharacterized membrane protein YeiH